MPRRSSAGTARPRRTRPRPRPLGRRAADPILCESRSLAGVLRPIAYRYTVPVAATNGQVGGFLHTEVGPLLRGGAAPGALPG